MRFLQEIAWVQGKTMMVETTLTFRGGPLDGASRRQAIPNAWKLVRYERPASPDGNTCHVYVGTRSQKKRVVQMTYVGVIDNQAEQS